MVASVSISWPKSGGNSLQNTMSRNPTFPCLAFSKTIYASLPKWFNLIHLYMQRIYFVYQFHPIWLYSQLITLSTSNAFFFFVIHLFTTNVWHFFAEYLFILEKQSSKFFNFIFQNFNTWGINLQNTSCCCPYVIVTQWFSIFNNFDK